LENAEIARGMTVVGGSLVRRFALDAQLTWVVGVVGPARVKLKFNVRLARSDFFVDLAHGTSIPNSPLWHRWAKKDFRADVKIFDLSLRALFCLFLSTPARRVVGSLGVGTNGGTGCCPAVQNPSAARVVVHRPEASTVHFPDTRSRALTSSTMARKALPIAAGVVVAGVASALLNRWLAKKAERRNPPIGRFITVEGVRLHYAERGTGTPLVLLHGNGSMIEDFQSSGIWPQRAAPAAESGHR